MDECNIEIIDTVNSMIGRNMVNSENIEKIHIDNDVVELIPLTPNFFGKKEKSQKFTEEYVSTRNSLLTQLFEDDHIRCAYRIFIFISLIIFYKSILDELVTGHEVTYNMKYLLKSFYDFNNVITSWTVMFLLTILVYIGYSMWAASRQSMLNHGTKGTLKMWNIFWLVALLTYFFLMIILPFSVTSGYPTMINQFIILSTQVIFMMKSYGFLRNEVGDALLYKPHSDRNMSIPTITKFIYFLLAPTLIYKDKYPRSERIKLSTIFSIIIEFILISMWINYLLCRIEEKYQYFGMQSITMNSLVLNILETILIAPCLYFSCFYVILHLFTNFWAEILRFSDRHFYEDWWNSTNIKNFCRSWNTILYEYIDTYVCKDVEKLLPLGETISSVTLIIFMSLIYEYLFCFTIGIFLPISFCICFISIPSLFINYNWSILNYLFLYIFVFGGGIQVSFIAIEYFAKMNCPYDEDNIWDLLEIRSFHCNGLSY